MEKLDEKSRDLLAYLNMNIDLSHTTLAEVFNQHYKSNIEDALTTLLYLESRKFIKTKVDKNNKNATVIMIQIMHLGRTYEQNLKDSEKEKKRKIWSERGWNIITLILSVLISVIVNLIMEG